MDASQLRAAIRDLAAIDAEGRLEELVQDHAIECRQRKLPNDNQLVDAEADFTARIIARAAATMFGLTTAECLRLAQDELRLHPRRDVALELIDWYRGRDDGKPTEWGQDGPSPRQSRRRDW